jgi:hypothetical protein
LLFLPFNGSVGGVICLEKELDQSSARVNHHPKYFHVSRKKESPYLISLIS